MNPRLAEVDTLRSLGLQLLIKHQSAVKPEPRISFLRILGRRLTKFARRAWLTGGDAVMQLPFIPEERSRLHWCGAAKFGPAGA
jgi:hypothetical protein